MKSDENLFFCQIYAIVWGKMAYVVIDRYFSLFLKGLKIFLNPRLSLIVPLRRNKLIKTVRQWLFAVFLNKAKYLFWVYFEGPCMSIISVFEYKYPLPHLPGSIGLLFRKQWNVLNCMQFLLYYHLWIYMTMNKILHTLLSTESSIFNLPSKIGLLLQWSVPKLLTTASSIFNLPSSIGLLLQWPVP